MNFDRDVAFPNKIRIIDLLNKIANGEEVPKKIKYPNKEKEYIYDLDVQDYRCDDTLIFDTLFSKYRTKFFINDEVEIIEEKEIPEKLEDYDFDESLDANTKCECLRERMQEIENQLDEIIDYLKSKGDE